MAEQILIAIVLDDSALQGAIPTLQKLGKISEDDAKKMSGLGNQTEKSFDKAVASGEKVAVSLSNVQKNATALANTFEKQVAGSVIAASKLVRKEMLNSMKSSAFDDLKNKINDVNAKLLETAARMESLRHKGAVDTEGYRKLEKELIAGKHEAERLAMSLGNVKQSVEITKPEIKGLATATAELDVAQESLRKQLSGVTEQMAVMALNGQNNSEEYEELAVKAGELKKAIGDAGKEVKALAQDSGELTFSATTQGLQALAAGAQATMAVQALFGKENEDLQKTLVKLNAVMALTQSLEQIRMATSKESNLVTGLSIFSTKSLAVANRLTASTYATLGFSVTATSTAFKFLRGAIIATGIGALVVAIGYAVNKIIEWTESTKSQAEAQEELNKKLEDYRKKLDDAFKDSTAEKARQASIKSIDREIKLLEAQGDQEVKIMDLKRQRAALELQSSRVRAATEQEYTSIQAEEAEKQKDISTDLRVEEIKAAKKAAEERQKIANENSKRAKERAERNAKAEFDIRERYLKREVELANQIVEDDANPSAIRLVALEDFLKKSEALIDANEAEELRKKDLTESEKKNVENKYYFARLDLLTAFNKKRTGIIATQWEELEKRIEASFSANSATFSKGMDKDLAEMETLFNMGLMTLKEYEAAREKIQAAYTKRNSENEIKRLEQIISNRKKANQDTTDLEKQLLDEKDRLRQADIDAHKKAEDEKRAATEKRIDAELAKMRLATEAQMATIELLMNSVNATIPGTGAEAALGAIANAYGNIKQATDQLAETQKKYDAGLADDVELANAKAAANQAYITSTIAGAQNMVNGIFAAAAQKRQEQLERELSTLQQQRDAEISNKNLTEEQKAAIDDRFRQREAQIKKAAFIREKQARISQAYINGLLAVTNALATAPTILAGIALAGAAVATTAIQVAKIKSEPIPQFKKGTKRAPKGMALVGEEGPELVQLKGGERIYTYKQSKKIMKDWEGGSQMQSIADSLPVKVDREIISNNNGEQIDYGKLASAIAENIKIPKPETVNVNNIIDENGLALFIEKKGNITRIRNKRYRM